MLFFRWKKCSSSSGFDAGSPGWPGPQPGGQRRETRSQDVRSGVRRAQAYARANSESDRCRMDSLLFAHYPGICSCHFIFFRFMFWYCVYWELAIQMIWSRLKSLPMGFRCRQRRSTAQTWCPPSVSIFLFFQHFSADNSSFSAFIHAFFDAWSEFP